MTVEERATELRGALVDELMDRGVIASEAVEKAMRAVPRHALLRDVWIPGRGSPGQARETAEHTVEQGDIDQELLALIYSDIPIVTKMTDGRPKSSTSQPGLVAQMLELLDLQPGMRVLEIGAGTGYNAALIAEIVGSQDLVTTIDIAPDVVEQSRRMLALVGLPDISVICADGALGHAESGPYDRIVATVGCTDIAPAWLDQLTPDGFLLIPLAHLTLGHPLIRVNSLDSLVTGRVVGPAGFMPIEGVLDDPPERRSARASQGEPRRSPVPPDMAGLVPSWYGPGWDFLYFLGLADANAGPGLRLADSEGSLRVEFGGTEILETGETVQLREELLSRVSSWNDHGRPKAEDWVSKFLPIDPPQSGEYQINRIHHTQIATLS